MAWATNAGSATLPPANCCTMET